MVRHGAASLGISVRQLPVQSSSKIIPEPKPDDINAHQLSAFNAGKNAELSFSGAFGPFGIPMMLIALACIVWTTFLMVLTVKPNAMANYLMDTAEFDNGTFWLIIEPDVTLVVFSVLALSVITFGYIDVFLQMTLMRGRKISNRTAQSPIEMAKAAAVRRLSSFESTNKRIQHGWTSLSSFRDYVHKYWNLWLKLADLAIQTLSFYQLLERGYPQILVYCYAGLVALNALVYAVEVVRYHSAFGEVLTDFIFDMLLAVAFPILVFVYSFRNFKLDREVLLLNMEVFPVGSFENIARMASDPAQIALFRLLFDSLRIQTPMDFVLRISMNLSICYRFKSVVHVLIRSRKRLQFPQQSFSNPDQNPSSAQTAQPSHPRYIGVVFIAFAITLLVSVYQAITSSKAVCKPYPECVAYAYQWQLETSKSYCPCIALIDANRVPTQEEWDNPINVTDKVRYLAMSGKLQVLQIINRRLIDLPDELQRCTDLRHMTLIYTDTNTLPAWAKNFGKLEYLHLEATPPATNLLALPDDLFASMKYLTFIHLGGHGHLVALPSFQGLANLKSLSLATLFKVAALPSFTSTPKLERLEMLALYSLTVLPDLAPLKNLVYFALVGRGMMCCNGFLGSVCNLSHPFCQASTRGDYPQATCLKATEEHASNETKTAFQRFADSVCVEFSFIGGLGGSNSTSDPGGQGVSDTNNCDNVANRRCSPNSNGDEGICVSSHMHVIACDYLATFVTVRRRQIERSIGVPCDPIEESWLGCV